VSLSTGDFKPIRLTGAGGLIGARAGQSAGFYVKLMSGGQNLSNFKLYFTSVTRVQATCGTAACKALPAGGTGENPLEKYIADNLPPAISDDFAPEEAHVIDEDTYMQQARDLTFTYENAVSQFVLSTLQPDTQLVMAGSPEPDAVQHMFLGLITPTVFGRTNPYYDDSNYDGIKDKRADIRENYIRSVYVANDDRLGLIRRLMGGDPTTFLSSDHGFAPQWYAVNATQVLVDNGLKAADTGNCRAKNADLAKVCEAGAWAGVYINLKGRDPTGVVDPKNYEAVRGTIINAFRTLTDPQNPGQRVIQTILNKEQLHDIDGSDSLHPSRSPDVTIVASPPYQFDAAVPGKTIVLSQFWGQHGYLPNTVDLASNINLHSVFVAGGPGIAASSTPVAGVRMVDLAPTVAFMMGVPGPQNDRGRILYNIVSGTSTYREVSILDISDYHGNLLPLTEYYGEGFGYTSEIEKATAEIASLVRTQKIDSTEAAKQIQDRFEAQYKQFLEDSKKA